LSEYLTGPSPAHWIAEAVNAKLILVAVPSLALVRQSLTDWARKFLAHNIKPDWFCVCADESVGNLERDTFVGEGNGRPLVRQYGSWPIRSGREGGYGRGTFR
jgi:hypothetical protein